MQVTFLGTGTSQGVPVIACHCPVCTSTDPKDSRLRCSVMLEVDGKTIVIDSGPDFRQQMLREQVQHLHAVVFTHEHKDHLSGLDDVRPFNYFTGEPMEVYATERVQLALKREFAYVFSGPQYPGIPRINLNTISNEPFDVMGVPFQPIEVLHHKLPVLGFRVHDFVYITDANYIAPEEKEKIKGAKVLVINALRREHHISHFTLSDAVALVEELQPEQAYFTHISHQLGRHVDVNAELPGNVSCAYDGLKITL
jgi:phosphoribosyl 1,2-cyclic phosphate phosphodiesterase